MSLISEKIPSLTYETLESTSTESAAARAEKAEKEAKILLIQAIIDNQLTEKGDSKSFGDKLHELETLLKS